MTQRCKRGDRLNCRSPRHHDHKHGRQQCAKPLHMKTIVSYGPYLKSQAGDVMGCVPSPARYARLARVDGCAKTAGWEPSGLTPQAWPDPQLRLAGGDPLGEPDLSSLIRSIIRLQFSIIRVICFI